MEEVISRAKACGEGEDGERCEKVRGALPPTPPGSKFFMRCLKASCASMTSPSACP